MIGRVLSKDLGGEEGDGVSVHWYTPKRSKNPCRRSVYGRGSWSTDFVYDSNNKRVADSGIESASVACFTFPCLLASGKLPAAVWVALEENVEPPSEAEEEEEKEKPLANAGGLGAAGSASLELPSGALKVRKTAAAFKPSRHTTRNHVKFRRDRVLQMHMFPCMYVGTVEVTTFCTIFVDLARNASVQSPNKNYAISGMQVVWGVRMVVCIEHPCFVQSTKILWNVLKLYS